MNYLFEFLINSESDSEIINNYNEFWFIKEGNGNSDLILKYIKSMINFIKNEDKNVLKIINKFLDKTELSKKIIFMHLILNKIVTENINILKYIGLILKENEDNLKNFIHTLLVFENIFSEKNKSRYADTKISRNIKFIYLYEK